MFFDVARIIDEKRPAAFLLENVKNSEISRPGRTFEVIRRTLTEDLGYELHMRVINGKHFTPQNRERIILVGFREPIDFDFDALEFEDLPVNGYATSSMAATTDMVAHDGNRFVDPFTGSPTPSTPSATICGPICRTTQPSTAPLATASDTDWLTRTESPAPFRRGTTRTVQRFSIPQEGRNPRRLTPRECARLMGFDDDFIIPVSDTQAYKQFGNSVVVPAIAAVAELMKPHIAARSMPALETADAPAG